MRLTSDQLNARVLQVIQDVRPTIGNRITKEAIAVRIFGRYTTSNDRVIRDSVTELTIAGHPICATSDTSGYYLARDYQEAEQCIAELRSRADVYDQKIDGIKRGLVNAHQPIREAVQMGLSL